MHKTINIVGAGMAGSLITRYFRKQGATCRVFDDGDAFSASRASSNLFITSWLKKFSSEEAARGISVLEELFPEAIERPFAGGIADAMKVRHIPQRSLLVEPDLAVRVTQASHTGIKVGNSLVADGPTILCLGYRNAELVPLHTCPELTVKVGHACFFSGDLELNQSRLAIVSPYVHEKLYQFAPGIIYYADSVAVKPEVYKRRVQELQDRTLARAQKLIGKRPLLELKVGYRPFITGHDFGLIQCIAPLLWVVNGGGKNGMVAYANAAKVLWDIVKDAK